jgi:hypothetical protein
MRRTLSIVVLALLVLASLPTFATAGENFKDVIVRNTADNAVVARLIGTAAVSGTVNVGNLPATQAVSGAVAVTNLPPTQQVTGSVAVSNLPDTQQVAGTVQQAAQTVRLARGALDDDQRNITLDVAAYRTVRITTRTNSTLCSVPNTEVVVTAPFTVDRFTVRAGGDASSLIEVPGTEIRITNAFADSCPVFFEVFGRAN